MVPDPEEFLRIGNFVCSHLDRCEDYLWSLRTQSTWRRPLRVKRWGNFHRRFTSNTLECNGLQRYPSRFHFIHTRTNAPRQAHLPAEHSCEIPFWWHLVSARNGTITFNPLEGMSNTPDQVSSGVCNEFLFDTVHICSTISFVDIRSRKTVTIIIWRSCDHRLTTVSKICSTHHVRRVEMYWVTSGKILWRVMKKTRELPLLDVTIENLIILLEYLLNYGK